MAPRAGREKYRLMYTDEVSSVLFLMARRISKIILCSIAALLVFLVGLTTFVRINAPTDGNPLSVDPPSSIEETPAEEGVMCTMDAQMCPDGSSVGRSSPDCAFAPCPGEVMEDDL